MVGFMGLPTELRLNILHYCNLVVDGDIDPYPSSHGSTTTNVAVLGGCHVSEKLDISLLRVNRQIRREASEILYGQNTWRLRSPLRPFWARGREVFRIQSRLFHHIKVDFGLAGITWDFLRDAGASARQDSAAVEPLARKKTMVLDQFHRNCLTELQSQWSFCFWLLGKMDLETLQGDISSCFCATGCCRLTPHIPWYMLAFGKQNHNTKVTIVGAKSPDEEARARDSIAREIIRCEEKRRNPPSPPDPDRD